MNYKYSCRLCETEQEISLPLGDDLPKEVECLKDECEGKAVYDWGQVKESLTIIPEHMQAGGYEGLNYTKIPRDKRRFH